MDFWFKKKTNKEIKELLDNNNYTYFYSPSDKVFAKIIFKKGKKIVVEEYDKAFNNLNINIYNSFEKFKNIFRTMRYKDYLDYNFYESNMDVNTVVEMYAKKHYGKEFVEVINNTLTIYRPSIIIKSDNGLTHEIKDAYINLKIINSYYYQLKLENMRRATVTSSEYREDYIHSHYKGTYTCLNQEGQFCKGDNNVSQILDAIHDNKLSFFKSLPYYFYILDTYLGHESTKGVPHRHIANVKKNKSYFIESRLLDLKLNYKELLQYSSCILNELSEINFNYISYSELNLDEKTNREINRISKNIKTDYKFLTIDDKNVTINRSKTYEHLQKKNDAYILSFKNKDIRLKIEDTDPNLDNLDNNYQSLAVTQVKQIIRFIENKINFNLWKKEHMK